jgi:uncharacterized surface protein with fasciclin (FAS1) repeats
MKRILTTLSCCSLILLFSCSTPDSKGQTAPSTTPEKNEIPTGLQNLTEAEKRGMRLLKRKQDEEKKSLQATEKNMSSAYKYLTTSDEYPIFTNLMAKSGLSKHIHSQNVTVLAPVDKAFDIYPIYKELLIPGNEEFLNEFISYHIIDISLEYKQFTDNTSWTVHTGESLELTNKGGIHFNGAHVRSGSINTAVGNIIGMDDLVFYPKFSE